MTMPGLVAPVPVAFFGGANVGWLADNKTVWFQSEESGYSHLYTADITNIKKKALTAGKYEVQSVDLSRDKKILLYHY
jgi:dipeptidyl aminopeptidase/acylaminoacyl peptidase